MAQRFGNKELVKGGVKRRATRRLAALRLENPKSLKGVNARDGLTGRESRVIRKEYKPRQRKQKQGDKQVREGVAERTRQRYEATPTIPGVNLDDGVTKREAHKVKRGWRKAGKPQPFDPLERLTGRSFADELKAAEGLAFGDRERELRNAEASAEQNEADTGNYYDDFRQALREATARIKATDDANVAATEGRVDSSFQQDKAAVAARDAAATAEAAKLGRGAQTSEEGARAVEAQRSQGNQSAARLRDNAGERNALMEKRGATSLLMKAEALSRERDKQGKIRAEKKDLEKEKGDFRVDQRSRARQSEREWAAIEKEFDLEKRGQDIDARANRQDRALEKQKIAAQKIVARIYASADKAGARAQVRVAKLQLEKGRITRHQYNTIRNIYEGLPGGGSANRPDAGTGNGNGSPTSGPQGSGPGGSLAPWERDKISNAVNILKKNSAKSAGRATWIKRMQNEGVPLRLARIAWRRYEKKFLTADTPGNAPGPKGQGDRPN